MEKRLSTSDLLVLFGFVFMLALIVFAFFFGIRYGASTVEKKYMAMLTPAEDAAAPYQQQDLGAFYHTIYVPYKEFQNDWLVALGSLAQGKTSGADSLLNRLSSRANDTSKEISAINMGHVPLLDQAQKNYIRALLDFSEVATAASKQKQNTYTFLTSQEAFNKAITYELSGHYDYYNAMLRWAATIDTSIPERYEVPSDLTIETWNNLPFMMKNVVVAHDLRERKHQNSFMAHDLTSQIDDFIQSGLAEEHGFKNISDIVDLIVSTKGVRAGDFLSNKTLYYDNSLMPQVPLFYPESN